MKPKLTPGANYAETLFRLHTRLNKTWAPHKIQGLGSTQNLD